jgi:hypothetical protein
MDTVYTYQNYEIIIKKCSDSVYIQFLDKQLFKMYSNTFIDIDVIRFNMTLNIFYKIMTTVIEAIVDEDDEMATLEIFPSMKNLKLMIHHKFHLEFIFELELNLIQDASLSAKDICIKKLEKKLDTLLKEHEQLKTLRIEHNELKSFVDNYMEVSIYNITGIRMNIKINTSNIIIKPIPNINSVLTYPIIENNYTIIYYSDQYLYNENFKVVKCYELIIHIPENGSNQSNIFHTLPLSIKKLIIKGYINLEYLRGKNNLPNLETIMFENCSEITKIYEYISQIKTIKNIIIKNCLKFQERDLLLTNGYNFKTE